MVFWLVRYIDNGVVGLWVPIDNGSCWSNGILAANRGGRVERLGGHHGHAPRGGSDDHVVDTVGSAKVQAVITQVVIDSTL